MAHSKVEQPDYDRYNREERNACAHLFRLLHEPTNNYHALRRFLGGNQDVAGFRIFTEVALIRDAYYERKHSPNHFMDTLVSIIAQQERVSDCRLYSQLEPIELRTPNITHPRKILFKGASWLSEKEHTVYKSVQGMFNAKPDLVICVGSQLLVYEAKLTLGFDEEQLIRTRKIAAVWSLLLFSDLGFQDPPAVVIRKVGREKINPDVSWELVKQIAVETYPELDRSRRALSQVAALD
ncbi:MAG: hypothetical protein HS116_20155 [Planctomycetes bacterium]|nr:hypothetical protein [Planctomycetota bacterium]